MSAALFAAQALGGSGGGGGLNFSPTNTSSASGGNISSYKEGLTYNKIDLKPLAYAIGAVGAIIGLVLIFKR